MTRPVVGVAGLGAMGRPIAARLAAHGFEVLGLDPHVTLDGVRRVDRLDEADVVLVIVPTDDDVTAVVTGILAAPRHRATHDPGRTGGRRQVIAICSSVRPETCRTLATDAAARGVDLLDVALTGGIRGAEGGTLNLLVGGDPAVAARLGGIFAVIASAYHVLGPVGAGQVAKAASNLIHWAEIVAIRESLRLADAYGVKPSDLRDALQQGGTDSRTLRELELMKFTWWEKDITVAEAMAAEVGIPLPVAGLSRRLMPTVTVESVRDLLS
ncbi:NAD(P)-binding domain-containing protein [Paractinoplanes globisporus]|uniref:NAD(P)-dependent oxidoreductase n=1 Tax=Paractinoplanes globisporus TaxID=113565 RepID=A0ABW6W7N3_9ACTN